MHDVIHRPDETKSYRNENSEIELSLTDIVFFFWRYRRLVGACVLASAILAVIYVLAATPIFTAKVQVLIESRMPQTFREYTSENVATLDTPAVESQIAIIMSEKIAEKVVAKVGFLDEASKGQDERHFSLNPLTYLRSLLKTDTPTAEDIENEKQRTLRDAMERLWGGMNVNRLGLSHVIEISYSAPNRDKAANVANDIADAYIEDQLETRADAAKQGSVWLEARIETLRRQMNEAGLRVKEFKARRDYRFPAGAGGTPDPQNSGPDASPPDPAAAATTLEDLESQSTTYRKIYESYLQAYTESVQTQSYPVTNTRIITRATRPNVRSWPRTSRVLAIAIVLGAMFGMGLALLHFSFTRSRRVRREA